jgi:hypothetical protein
MLDPIVRILEQLVLEFSWKRMLNVLLIFSLAAAVLGFLEWYTSYLSLMRIEQSVKILAKLQEIRTRDVGSQPELNPAYHALLVELNSATFPRTVGWQIPDAPRVKDFRPVWKFLAGAAPMWVVGLFALFVVGRNREAAAVTAAMFLVGSFFGVIGFFIPTILWPWVNLVLYPIGYVLVLAGFGILIGNKEEPADSPIRKAYEQGDTSMT